MTPPKELISDRAMSLMAGEERRRSQRNLQGLRCERRRKRDRGRRGHYRYGAGVLQCHERSNFAARIHLRL